jgi:hypothetical protein
MLFRLVRILRLVTTGLAKIYYAGDRDSRGTYETEFVDGLLVELWWRGGFTLLPISKSLFSLEIFVVWQIPCVDHVHV